jgi:hypothetical protein
MIAPLLLSSATDSPLLLGEEIEVRSTEKAVETMKLTKKQIEVTVFVCGVGRTYLELVGGLKMVKWRTNHRE